MINQPILRFVMVIFILAPCTSFGLAPESADYDRLFHLGPMFDLYIDKVVVDGVEVPDSSLRRPEVSNADFGCRVGPGRYPNENRLHYMVRVGVLNFSGLSFAPTTFSVGEFGRTIKLDKEQFLSGNWSLIDQTFANQRFLFENHTLIIEDWTLENENDTPILQYPGVWSSTQSRSVKRVWKILWNADLTQVLQADVRFEIFSKGKAETETETYRVIDISCVKRS